MPLLADRRHIVNALIKLIGNTLFMQEKAKALGVGEGRRGCEEAEFVCHGAVSSMLVRMALKMPEDDGGADLRVEECTYRSLGRYTLQDIISAVNNRVLFSLEGCSREK
ncbi:hypothetical protein HDE76_000588 [Rhodanobacter sp. ANJX3]|uniref:hypothetical protein n=1 Tax=unclassified Rhodanobacter TaxID=2621553 RepID=UPI0017B8E16C|nr:MULTISPECIES: hypothetical protein [unclassified Rhodanobacter]MBB5357406.1 hypothetical protein [Rhodanobacter sp. ANJX3]NYE27454.1 hypothetical protein [Rhodanobacter sp. K2T2]